MYEPTVDSGRELGLLTVKSADVKVDVERAVRMMEVSWRVGKALDNEIFLNMVLACALECSSGASPRLATLIGGSEGDRVMDFEEQEDQVLSVLLCTYHHIL